MESQKELVQFLNTELAKRGFEFRHNWHMHQKTYDLIIQSDKEIIRLKKLNHVTKRDTEIRRGSIISQSRYTNEIYTINERGRITNNDDRTGSWSTDKDLALHYILYNYSKQTAIKIAGSVTITPSVVKRYTIKKSLSVKTYKKYFDPESYYKLIEHLKTNNVGFSIFDIKLLSIVAGCENTLIHLKTNSGKNNLISLNVGYLTIGEIEYNLKCTANNKIYTDIYTVWNNEYTAGNRGHLTTNIIEHNPLYANIIEEFVKNRYFDMESMIHEQRGSLVLTQWNL